MLGILFFGERMYKDIHDEPKNKITTQCEAKGRVSKEVYYAKILPFIIDG